ncbi:DNA-binding protein [Dyella acidiphila]|uniref:DNA-binding protein n=1 Tax=Dyella acidiphila TaxID=2775866 RepID=A0ABR9GC21_9GAMM|nr:DNA-binding protein [Dyella acidiphila]MBE1161569.1 DNA-binding protein [Dyella acidiphila]
MASGVPETDVFKAADAVLARGERPTVERVRLELGRGSPARVGQLLEQWWERLAQRLKGHALLPNLPGEVAQAFSDTWRLALAQAAIVAHAALAEEQNALFAEQTSLTQERKLWEIALTEAQTNMAESAAKLAQADAQLRERQVLVDQLEAQRTDLLQQRDRLQEQLGRQQVEMDDLRAKHNAAQEHIRAVEDRAHQQVDQARQEIKSLQQRLEREQRDHHKLVTQLSMQQDDLRNAVRAAEQVAAHQTGRVTALEATLTQWRNQAPPSKRQSRKGVPEGKGKPRNRAKKIPP